MIKNPKIVTLGLGVLHIIVGAVLMHSLPVITFGVLYTLCFFIKNSQFLNKHINSIKFISILTFASALFGLLINNDVEVLRLSYLLLTLLCVPIGATLLKSKSQLNIYCIYNLCLAISFSTNLDPQQSKVVLISFLSCLAFIYLASSRRISLEESETSKKLEINRLINNFPGILLKKTGNLFQSINMKDYSISNELVTKINEMIDCQMYHIDNVAIEDRFYEIKISVEANKESYVFLRDMTDKVQHLNEIEDNRIKLANSSKLAALGEMAGGVAHEINNPLQILSLHNEQVRMLLMNDDLNTSKKDLDTLCDDMENTIERINNIVKGMKIISRNGNNDPFEACDVREVVNETLAVCKEKFKNNGVKFFFYEEEGENYTVMAQKVRLSQVVLNILSNAFDAIEKNNKKIIRVYLSKSENLVNLSISDNGPGVPEELIAKVFQPFFTTKAIGKGTGLGLSISKEIIEQHNGIFSIDPEDHSKFIISIPELNKKGESHA